MKGKTKTERKTFFWKMASFGVFSFSLLTGIILAQDIERWFLIRPGYKNEILKAPMNGEPPKGFRQKYRFEAKPTRLRKFCRELEIDSQFLGESISSFTAGDDFERPPTLSEIQNLQAQILQAAVNASNVEQISSAPRDQLLNSTTSPLILNRSGKKE